MRERSINHDVVGLAEPVKPISYLEGLKQSIKDGAPMLGCSFVGMAADFTAAMLVYQNLGTLACVIYAIFNSLLEWPMAAVSVGLSTSTAQIAKTAGEYHEEYLHHLSEGIEHPNRLWGKIGSHIQHGFFQSLLYAMFFSSILIWAAGSIARGLGCKEEAIPGVIDYSRAYAIGTAPSYFFQYFGNQINFAFRRRLPVAIIQAIAGVIGIGSGYALMKNIEGSDVEKLIGMGYGMSIRYIVAALGHIIYLACTQHKVSVPDTDIRFNIELFKWHGFDKKYFRNILANGFLTQIFVFVEVAMISVMTVLASQGEDSNVEAAQIAIQFLGIPTVFEFVNADTLSILTSTAIGRGQQYNVARLGVVTSGLGIITQLAFLALFLSIPDQLIGFFRKSSDTGEIDPVRDFSYTAIIGMSLAQPFDAMRLILGGGLRGMQDFGVSCIASALLLMPITYYLGKAISYEGPNWGIAGVVAARDLAIVLAAIVVTAWYLYKVRNQDQTFSKVMGRTFFGCCKPNEAVEQENYFENESTSLLDRHVQSIEHDPELQDRYRDDALAANFRAPNVFNVFR